MTSSGPASQVSVDAHPVAVTPRPPRLVGLDGLRGYLALSVILVHTFGMFAPIVLKVTHAELLGQVIVVFFVLSGFLIGLPFLTRLIDGRTMPSTVDYARARVFRVWPVYLVVLLIANFALAGLFLDNAMQTLEPYTDHGTGRILDPWRLLLHATLLQNYVPSELQTGINSSWTLTVEITFYALLPVVAGLAALIGRRVRVRRPYLLAASTGLVFVVIGVVSRIVVASVQRATGLSLLEAEWGDNALAVVARSLLVWSDNFGIGMLTAVAYVAATRGVLTRIAGLRLRPAMVAIMGLALVLAAVSLKLDPRVLPVVVAVWSGAFILFLVLPNRRGDVARFSLAMDWAPVRYVGLISLSTYLWHYPILLLWLRSGWSFPDTIPGALGNLAVIAAGSIAVGSVTYWLVERPAQLWAAKRAKQRRAASADAAKAGS